MSRTRGAKALVSDIDPFCREFFEKPFPAYEEVRDADALSVAEPRTAEMINRGDTEGLGI
jgi:hypothetical protein